MNPSLSKLIRAHYLDLQGYVSAGMEFAKDESKIFLNANENPFELPGLAQFNRYPQPQPQKLLHAYATLYGVGEDNIIMTRGADEAIQILTKIFCEPHEDSILISSPAFGMYAVGANGMPAAIVDIPLKKENGTFTLDKNGIIAASKKAAGKIKLIYICSPNNPTATSFAHADVLGITKAVEGNSIVILDETYAEFSRQGSLTHELPNHLNMIILRTLSKSYSMAGMRMGCFLSADKDFIAFCRSKTLDAYPLPLASIDAALHVADPLIQKIARENIKKLLEEKERLVKAFGESEAVRHIYPSDANFFLVEMENAKGFYDYCIQHNVILRDFSSKPGTENCLRISSGTHEQNNKLLKLLRDFTS